MSSQRPMLGGIVLRVDGVLTYVPATVALKVAPMPKVARVAGAPAELLGIGLQDGEILPVIAIGRARATMIVCSHAGERLGIVGGEVLQAGMLEVVEGSGDHATVTYRGERTELLDLAPIYARVQAGGWIGRFGT